MHPGNTEPTLTQPNPRRSLFYLLPIILFPVLLLAAAFLIVPTHWFVARSNSPYLANFGYAESLHGQSCDVLIYGDSTAMVGVSPRLLTEQTGLSACNIAEFEGMTLVSNTLLVDDFLAHNPRPRFIVFLYAPENLHRPASWDTVSTFEATSFMLHEHPGLPTFLLLARHPSNTFAWAEQGLRMALQRVHSQPYAPEKFHLRDATLGQLPMSGRTLDACDAVHRQALPDPAWLDDLRTRYAVGGTTVLIDATPVADCDASLDYDRRNLQDRVDNATGPAIYQPITVSSFTDDGRLHANATGAARITTLIAAQIQSRLKQQQAAGAR